MPVIVTYHCVQLLEPAAVNKDVCLPVPDEAVGGKRKRKEDERENNVKVAKKQKPLHSEENTTTAEQEPPRRGGRTRRTQRLKTKEEEEEMKEKVEPTLKVAPIPCKDDSGVLVDDLKMESDTKRAGVFLYICNFKLIFSLL